MDLKNLLTDEEAHKLKELAQSLRPARDSVSKTWRLLDSLIKKMDAIGGKNA